MVKKLRFFLVAAVLVSANLAEAQQAKKIPVIGVLLPSSASDYASHNETFLQGLRQLGYLVGQNILIEYRYAEGKADRLPELAAELVRLKVDVIVTSSASAVRAARKVTTTLPVVVATAGDLVGSGLVAS